MSHAPTFPMSPEIGQRVFFEPLSKAANTRLSYYGTIIGRVGKKWRVNLHNSTSKMLFDPTNGIANPFIQQHKLCWIGGDEYKGMNYNDAMILAVEQLKEADGNKT